MTADLGWVLHWQPSETGRLTVPELRRYHALALERARIGAPRG